MAEPDEARAATLRGRVTALAEKFPLYPGPNGATA